MNFPITLRIAKKKLKATIGGSSASRGNFGAMRPLRRPHGTTAEGSYTHRMAKKQGWNGPAIIKEKWYVVLYINRGHDTSTVKAALWKNHVVQIIVLNLVKVTWSSKGWSEIIWRFENSMTDKWNSEKLTNWQKRKKNNREAHTHTLIRQTHPQN